MAGILLAFGKKIIEKFDGLNREFLSIKRLENSNKIVNKDFCISKFARTGENDENFIVGEDVSIFCTGTIFYKNVTGKTGLENIAASLLQEKIQSVVHSLDGHYVLVIIDNKIRTINVVTDHAGIIHLYIIRDAEDLYLSTSSRVFSKNFNVTFDIDGLSQYLRCDSICDSDTIYNEIKVLEAATIYTFNMDSPGNFKKEIYWKSPTSIQEDMSIKEATDLWANTLLDVGKMITPGDIICDLTGGYDTRSLLAGLLPNVRTYNNLFSTFVFGPHNSTEVRVAKEICSQLDIDIMHLTLPDNWPQLFYGFLKQALNYTDGEENLGNFASILYANQIKKKSFNTSVNGMSGGCVRPFFWVQELTYEKKPANIDRFLNMRAFQYEFEVSVFANDWQKHIKKMPDLLSKKYLNSIADMDLYHTYNTLQLDNIDLRQRERRWGGRTISSSNQIIKIISPLYFKKCMETGFTIPPKYKIRDLLNRKVITKLSPKLAKQKMITGVPCEEITIKNLYRFLPLLSVYIKKFGKVFSQQILNKTMFIDKTLSFPKYKWYDFFLTSKETNNMSNVESWVTNKIYDKKRFNEFISGAKKPGFRYYGQLDKMISLEIRVREDRIDENDL